MSKRDKTLVPKIILCFCVIAFVILAGVYLLRGQVTSSGEYPEDVAYESLFCEVEGVRYSYAEYDNSDKKEMKISAMFGQKGATSVSLMYNLYYGASDLVAASEAFNHADMNTAFSNAGFGADALNANYSKQEDKMRLSLYATGSNIDSAAMKFFMFENWKEGMGIEEFQNHYENMGFTCNRSE